VSVAYWISGGVVDVNDRMFEPSVTLYIVFGTLAATRSIRTTE
jgi:hypothetical protein